MRVYESDPEYHIAVYGIAPDIKKQCEYWKMVEHKERLEAACAEAHQVVSQMLLKEHERPEYTSDDVTRVLDNLVAAIYNSPLPHTDLLPWPKK